jgi:hypothetical protein
MSTKLRGRLALLNHFNADRYDGFPKNRPSGVYHQPVGTQPLNNRFNESRGQRLDYCPGERFILSANFPEYHHAGWQGVLTHYVKAVAWQILVPLWPVVQTPFPLPANDSASPLC